MKNPWDMFRGSLFLFACLLISACQVLFGEYKSGQPDAGVANGLRESGNSAISGGTGVIGDNGASGGILGNAGGGASAASTDDSGTPTCDSDGTYRCTEAALEVCQNHQWQPQVACAKDLCDAERGRCMLCSPGAERCMAWSLEACSSTGDSWTVAAECDTAAYCDSVSKTCLACLPGESFCSGTRLYVCKHDQSGWAVTDCQDANLCNARVGSCRPCITGEYQCNAESLQVCDDNQAWTQADLCASSELCQASLSARANDPTAWSQKCNLPECNAGDYRCNPNNMAELQGCPPSRLDWNLVDTCLTSALCNAVAKQCDKGCVPGTYQCNGARLELCRQDGTGFDLISTCQDANHCNIQQRDCVPCVAGESQCSGATLQTCGTDLAWKNQQACASTALCDAPNGQCTPQGCQKAGAFSCDAANLRICPPDLVAWAPQAVCVTPVLCDAANGRCIQPQCPTPGEYRCQGNTREQCDSATRTWMTVNTCATGQICDLTSAAGCLGTCPAVTTRCNTTSAQADVEKCAIVNNLPQWQYVESCATSALCILAGSGASCQTPACAVNQYQCTGSTLQHCNAGRTGWDATKTCAPSQICDATGAQCDNCLANSYACSSKNLTQCSSDGQSSATLENCGTAAHCYTSADKITGYCYRCDTGNSQCVGTDQIQVCATDRRSWNLATSCANGCQNNPGDADYCAACAVAGEIQCVQSASPGSTRTCPANRSDWRATAACAQGYGCVDNGTSDYCASACTPNASACVGNTGLHTCAADGKGWGATVSQCADTGNLKACVSGAFSGTSACALSTPYCVAGQCVACTGTTTECLDAATTRHCNAGSWVSAACAGSTPVCSAGTCVACTSASSPTCIGSNTRQYCSGTSWTTGACTGSTPFCQGGSCVACTSTSTPSCVNTNTVQSCSGNSWVNSTCSAPNPSCYEGACKPCNADTPANCQDNTTRRFCTAGAFATASCNVAGSTACLNGACVGCNSSSVPKCATTTSLSTCSTSGAWVDSACPVATPTCAGTPGKCVQCSPDSAWVCSNSTTRHSCTNSTLVDQVCATGQICDPADATCKTPTCAVGQNQCSGNVLQQCNATRTGWTDIKTCSGTNPVCSAGACVVCNANASECVGATGLHNCAADGSGWGPTSTQCSDAGSLKTCVNGAFTTTVQTCPSTAPACVTGKCLPCNPNSAECVGTNGLHNCAADGSAWGATLSQCADNGSLKACASGAFIGSTACPTSTPICVASGSVANCTTATCAIGQNQCAGNIQQICNATRTGWDNVTTCAGTTPLCLPTSGVCGCSVSTDCNATSATPVCTGSQCVAATCAVGQHQCSGNTLQVCNAARSGWDSVSVCSASQICDPTGGTCKTAICSVGQNQCSGNILQVCNTGRTGWDSVTTCTASQICDAASGTCKIATCAVGQHQCLVNVSQICNAARTGWDSVTACAGTTPVCSLTSGICGCSASTDCIGTPATPICDTVGGICVRCVVSSDCSGTTPVCAIGACIGCSKNKDCSGSSTCQPDGSCL